MQVRNASDYTPDAAGGSALRRLARGLPGARGAKRWLERALGYEDVHWCRVVMNRECERAVAAMGPANLDVLEISGDSWKGRLPFRSHRSANYPEFDACERALDERFDLIIAEQVFEHVLWPHRAARNVYTMLKPGGKFLISTPFLLRVHPVPVDCGRWTETGLKHMLADCGWSEGKITTGSWGNRACVKGNFTRWARYNRYWHSLKNEPLFPLVVWAVAEK